MKQFILLMVLAISIATEAQVTKVSLQASGLTCSMCSNAINKALKTLHFVADVEADVKNYTFDISFKPNTLIDFDQIKMKVEDAGFSVSGFIAAIDFKNVQVQENSPVSIGSYTFLFVNGNGQSLHGVRQVKLLDKGFVSSKEYRKGAFAATAKKAGLYHVSL